jgi:hypothetical protein
MALVDNPTLAWPVAIVNGGTFDVVEARSNRAVIQSVARICQVEMGTMLGRPDIGLPSLEFVRGAVDPDEIKELIERQEPDADVTVLAVPEPGQGWEALDIQVVSVAEAGN